MRSLAPIKLPGFSHLAGAYAANELGNWIGEIALAVLVYDQTGSPLASRAVLGNAVRPWVPRSGAGRTGRAGRHEADAATAVSRRGGHLRRARGYCGQLRPLVGGAARRCRRHTRDRRPCPDARLRGGGAEASWVAARGQRDHQRRLHRRRSDRASARRSRRRHPRYRDRPAARRRLVRAGRGATRGGHVTAPGEGAARALVGKAGGGVLLREQPACPAPADDDAGRRVRVLQPRAADRDRVREGDARRRDSGYGALLSAWGVGMVFGSLVFLAGRQVPMGVLLFTSTLAVSISYLGMAVAGTLAVDVLPGLGEPATACSGWR